jgi:hypothetical protein
MSLYHTTHERALHVPDLPPSVQASPSGLGTQHIDAGRPFASHVGAASHGPAALRHIGVAGHRAPLGPTAPGASTRGLDSPPG